MAAQLHATTQIHIIVTHSLMPRLLRGGEESLALTAHTFTKNPSIPGLLIIITVYLLYTFCAMHRP